MSTRSTEGQLGILPRHAPLLAVLAPGEVRIDRTGGESESIFVGGGFMEVLPDRVTVLADVAERADDINLERAEASRRSAAERLAGGPASPAEEIELQMALLRAEARLRLARARRGGG